MKTLYIFGLILLLGCLLAPSYAQYDEEEEVREFAYDGMTPEETEALKEKAESHKFETEVNRMMTLIINSLYRNKEIFLRELISNASDALDKIRFLSLTKPELLEDQPDLKIEIKADKENNILHITDTGIGMTKSELIKNLGTIAKSGTSEFLAAAETNTDANNLIGQFGVGFYSAFLVADTVTVTSRHPDSGTQFIWESTADNSFTVVEDPRGNTLGRGTRISLYLKEEAAEFLEQQKLKDLIKKYSEFINFPIYLWTTRTESIEVEDEDYEEEEDSEIESEVESDEEVELGDEEDLYEEDEGPKMKTVTETINEFQLMNENKPIWTRSPEEIEEEEYNSFYKSFSKDAQDPAAHIHFRAEGEIEFKSLLYVPAKAPSNLYSGAETDNSDNIKLYVRRVFITDTELETLLPKYLKFVKGIVDSDDLPLNISRETLQQHKMLKVIKKKLTRKALEMFRKLSEDDEEKYLDFYKEYSVSLKLGAIEDTTNRKRIAKLLRFQTSQSNDEFIGLDDYVERMKKGQENIYFLTGPTLEEVKASPFLERLEARGYEVVYLYDPMDEYTFQSLLDYDSYKFQNIAKEGLKFGDEDDESQEEQEKFEEEYEPLTKWLGEVLAEKIDKAIITNRLTTSPCALVASKYGWSGNMERIMQAQAYNNPNDPMSNYYAKQKKTLEINPKHPVMQSLLNNVVDDTVTETTEELAEILYETAALRSGYSISDTVVFATRIEKVIRENLGVDLDAQAEVDEKPAPERDDEEEEDEYKLHDEDQFLEEIDGDAVMEEILKEKDEL